MDIVVGDVFESKTTGNRFKVTAITLGHSKADPGKVSVQRLEPPKWDDGRYVFVPCQFSELSDLRLVEVGR